MTMGYGYDDTVMPVARLLNRDDLDDSFPAAGTTVDSDKTYSWKAHVCDMADINQAARKTWILTVLQGQAVDVENPPTMKFEHGRLDVFGGINRLSGTYALVGDTVIMGQLVSTMMAGPPPLMELESTFARVLASVDSFHAEGDTLELVSKDSVVTRFRHQQ